MRLSVQILGLTFLTLSQPCLAADESKTLALRVEQALGLPEVGSGNLTLCSDLTASAHLMKADFGYPEDVPDPRLVISSDDGRRSDRLASAELRQADFAKMKSTILKVEPWEASVPLDYRFDNYQSCRRAGKTPFLVALRVDAKTDRDRVEQENAAEREWSQYKIYYEEIWAGWQTLNNYYLERVKIAEPFQAFLDTHIHFLSDTKFRPSSSFGIGPGQVPTHHAYFDLMARIHLSDEKAPATELIRRAEVLIVESLKARQLSLYPYPIDGYFHFGKTITGRQLVRYLLWHLQRLPKGTPEYWSLVKFLLEHDLLQRHEFDIASREMRPAKNDTTALVAWVTADVRALHSESDAAFLKLLVLGPSSHDPRFQSILWTVFLEPELKGALNNPHYLAMLCLFSVNEGHPIQPFATATLKNVFRQHHELLDHAIVDAMIRQFPEFQKWLEDFMRTAR